MADRVRGVIPFVSILLAGVVAALIGRAAVRRSIDHHDDAAKAAAVAGVITAARKATTWSSLGAEERAYTDHLGHESEVRLRLLPVPGARSAADWAEHELADIKRNSATFTFQAEQSFAVFRDRMIDWQAKPKRAKKLFRDDLERWRYEEADADAARDAQQRAGDVDRAAANAQAARPASGPTPVVTPAPDSASYARPTVSAEPAPVDVTTDDEHDLDADQARYGEPVSAHQVRRRTSPDLRIDQ